MAPRLAVVDLPLAQVLIDPIVFRMKGVEAPPAAEDLVVVEGVGV
jgi:hypothetical protein